MSRIEEQVLWTTEKDLIPGRPSPFSFRLDLIQPNHATLDYLHLLEQILL